MSWITLKPLPFARGTASHPAPTAKMGTECAITQVREQPNAALMNAQA
jgi:hypothetical protein